MVPGTMSGGPSRYKEGAAEQLWLEKLIGRWVIEGELKGVEAERVRSFSGTEHVSTLDGGWFMIDSRAVVAEAGPVTNMAMMGFDPAQGRVSGSWKISSEPRLWLIDGSLEEGGEVLTLDAEVYVPSESDRDFRYRQKLEFRSPDHRVVAGEVLNASGDWEKCLQANCWRTNW